MGKSKIIKDMPKADFISALKGYKDGSYGGAQKALMVAQVKDMDEATMNEIAATIIK
jgi:cytochrome c553